VAGDRNESRALRRDAEENRRRILAAAGRLMRDEGLGVGHNEIARAAGVAVGTVYRRFPDKTALVDALFTEHVEQVVNAARAALSIEDPWQAIVEFMTATVGTLADSRGLRELSAGSPHGEELARYTRAQIAPVVAQLVARGHAAGVLRPDVAEQDLALVPIMVGSVIEAARHVDPQLWRRALAIVLAGMRAGVHEPLPGAAPSGEQIARLVHE
jgi:AcrR family transcriptional regulator